MNGKKTFFSVLVLIAAFIGTLWCVYYYGLGVYPYYAEQYKKSSGTKAEEVYWLGEGTIVDQLYKNRDSYMVGLDLYLLGTGEGCQGTLYIQLCDADGNLLSQKREKLEEIEPGKRYPVRFLENVDVRGHENLIIRFFVGENNIAPGLITAPGNTGVQDNISCSVNGEQVPNNVAISYLNGRWQYVGYRGQGKTMGDMEALAASFFLILMAAFFIEYFIFSGGKVHWKKVVSFFGDYDNQKQILSVLWFFCIFLGASVVYKIARGQDVPVWVCLYLLCVVAATVYLVRRRHTENKAGKNTVISDDLHDKWLIAVVLLSTIIRIPLFVHIQLWDGSLYYNAIKCACSNFEYSLSYIWNNFRLCGHYAVVYTLFTAIGEFLMPERMTGVLIVVLVLMVAALVCVYKMLMGYWLNLSRKEAAIGTMLVSVCPLFLGLFSNVSLDNLLVVFTIFLLYAEYKEQSILKLVWIISIVMTKETGIVIVGGYLFVHICICLRNAMKQDKKDRLSYFLSDFHVICTVLGAVLLCLLTIKQNGLFTWMGMANRGVGSMLSELTAKISDFFLNFGDKIKILFILHFEWIPVLIIIVCLLYSFIKKKERVSFPGQVSFLGTLGAFVLANIYLYDYLLARYHIFSAVMLWILAYIMLLKTFRNCLNHLAGICVTVAIGILMILENFFFIDPFTNMSFAQFDTGKGKMISTEKAGGNYSETFASNFRHTYLFDLIDNMLADCDFDTDMQIVIPTETDRLNFYNCVGYDKEEKRRAFEEFPDGEKIIPLNHIYLKDVTSGAEGELAERGVIYFTPYIGCDEQETLKIAGQFYEIGERREISNWGGTLAYYVLKLK